MVSGLQAVIFFRGVICVNGCATAEGQVVWLRLTTAVHATDSGSPIRRLEA